MGRKNNKYNVDNENLIDNMLIGSDYDIDSYELEKIRRKERRDRKKKDKNKKYQNIEDY